MSRASVVAILKEYKEIIVLLAAIGGLAATSPSRATTNNNTDSLKDDSVSLKRIAAQLDNINRQVESLVRLQCSQTDSKTLILAGVHCP